MQSCNPRQGEMARPEDRVSSIAGGAKALKFNTVLNLDAGASPVARVCCTRLPSLTTATLQIRARCSFCCLDLHSAFLYSRHYVLHFKQLLSQ